jgi:hypothetical protein
MAQHFLLSAGARSLSAAKIMRMSDGEVETVFLRLRWPETDGKPVCPDCGCTVCYTCPRPSGQLRWRCKALSGWQIRPGHGSVPGMTTSPNPYRGFRFPAEIIEHAVWLYHCFSLSLRDVETILAARGVVVSYESIREWGLRFGRLFANTLKRRRPKPGDK